MANKQTLAQVIPEVSKLITEINHVLHLRSEERSVVYKELSDMSLKKKKIIKDALREELSTPGLTVKQAVSKLLTLGAPKQLEVELLAHERNANDDYYPALQRAVEKYADDVQWAARERDNYDESHVRARVLEKFTSALENIYRKPGMFMPELLEENYVPRKKLLALVSSGYRRASDHLATFPGGTANYFKSMAEADTVATMRQSLTNILNAHHKLHGDAKEELNAAMRIKRRVMSDAEFTKEMITTTARAFSEKKVLPSSMVKVLEKHTALALEYAQADAKEQRLQAHSDACEALDRECRRVHQQLTSLHNKLSRAKNKHTTTVSMDFARMQQGLRGLGDASRSVSAQREALTSYEFSQPIMHRALLSQDMYNAAYWMLILDQVSTPDITNPVIPSFEGGGGTFDGGGASGDWGGPTQGTALDNDTQNNLFGLAGLSAVLATISTQTEDITKSVQEVTASVPSSTWNDDSYRSSGTSGNSGGSDRSYGSDSDTGSSRSDYSTASPSYEPSAPSYSSNDSSPSYTSE